MIDGIPEDVLDKVPQSVPKLTPVLQDQTPCKLELVIIISILFRNNACNVYEQFLSKILFCSYIERRSAVWCLEGWNSDSLWWILGSYCNGYCEEQGLNISHNYYYPWTVPSSGGYCFKLNNCFPKCTWTSDKYCFLDVRIRFTKYRRLSTPAMLCLSEDFLVVREV